MMKGISGLWVGVALFAIGGCTSLAGLDKEVHLAGGGGAGATTGSTSDTSTGVVSSAATGGALCKENTECLPDGPCAAPACVAGQCVETSLNDGLQIPDPAGNCEKTQCMGAVLVISADAVDFADDGEPCTVDACGASGPTHDPGNDGALCGKPGHHCLGGTCVECAVASQCPQGADACSVATCAAGLCGLSAAADGTGCGAVAICKEAGSCSGGVCVQPPASNGTTCLLNGMGMCAGGNCCTLSVCGNGNVCCNFGQICNAFQLCKP